MLQDINVLIAVLKDQTEVKMAKAIITVKLMMESPEVDLSKVEEEAKKVVAEIGGEFGKSEIEPIAFGLKALNIMLIADESIGSDTFQDKMAELEGVSNAQVTDFRRALG